MAKKASSKAAGTKKAAGKAGGGARGRAADFDAPAARPEGLAVPAPIPMGELIGHARAIAVLRAAASSGRVHHAWIFHGPAGVGKRTAALAFAAMLLEPGLAPNLAGELAPDPDSPVQTLLRAGSHPDLHLVSKELARWSSESKVRDSKLTTINKEVIEEFLIRPARLAAAMPPGGLASKVFIVDGAEALARNDAAQNAILKNLEEPPAGTVIILVTDSEDALLPTIRSRCQRVAFGPLGEDEMQAWLSSSGLDLPEAHASWLLGYAAGSPGVLTEAVRVGLGEWRRELEPLFRVADEGGHPVTLAATMAQLAEDRAKAWVDEGTPLGENRSKEVANRLAQRQLLALVASRYRHALKRPELAERAAGVIEAVAEAERELTSNVQPGFVFQKLVEAMSDAALLQR
jgi:hypothetical protein